MVDYPVSMQRVKNMVQHHNEVLVARRVPNPKAREPDINF